MTISTPDQPTRKVSINLPTRAGAAGVTSPHSPHTPNLHRSTSSFYGSPSSGLRGADEECVVLDIGARFLRAGFAGESAPRVVVSFGPEEQRRVGDYRRWLPSNINSRPPSRQRNRTSRWRREDAGDSNAQVSNWGKEHELWRMDMREVDLSLVEDKVERAMREIMVKYFLSDARPKRCILSLPPLIPRPLLTSLLTTLFLSSQTPSVTLLSSPVLSAISAGVRSALVVDIGWAETVVTAVYEYREVGQKRSVRASKWLSESMAKFLTRECAKQSSERAGSQEDVSFEETEEVLARLGWCMDRDSAEAWKDRGSEGTGNVDEHESSVEIPLIAAYPDMDIRVPFSALSHPAETALFAQGVESRHLDDNDHPIHLLVYKALLSLSADVRSCCMNRIVFTGGASNLIGIKRRVLQELAALVEECGWDPIRSYGKASSRRPALRKDVSTALNGPPPSDQLSHLPSDNTDSTSHISSTHSSADGTFEATMPSAAFAPQEPDAVMEKIRRQNEKYEQPRQTVTADLSRAKPQATNGDEEEGTGSETDTAGHSFRAIESMGAWAGASMLSSLRIRGVVEIERERFLQHGLGGSSREKEVNVVPQRQSLGGLGMRTVSSAAGGDRSNWTLGVWA